MNKILFFVIGVFISLILGACTSTDKPKIEVIEDESLGFQNPDVCFDYKENGFVPDKETAAKIAVAVWSPIYGEEDINKEMPYRVKLIEDSIWIVEGSFNGKNDLKHFLFKDSMLGGTAYVEIRKSDGKVLRMIHGE